MGRRDRRRRGRARAGFSDAVAQAPDARGARAPGGGGVGAVAPRRRVVGARREPAVLVDVGDAMMNLTTRLFLAAHDEWEISAESREIARDALAEIERLRALLATLKPPGDLAGLGRRR